MPLSAPASINQDHQDLLELLVRIQHLSGKTGTLAENLATRLRNHMEKEESVVMPLLGILTEVAKDKLGRTSARKAAGLYEEFEKAYPEMVGAHRELMRKLARLKKVGADEGHLTAVRFAEQLVRHSQEEEEILYPAALMAGKIAAKLNEGSK